MFKSWNSVGAVNDVLKVLTNSKKLKINRFEIKEKCIYSFLVIYLVFIFMENITFFFINYVKSKRKHYD